MKLPLFLLLLAGCLLLVSGFAQIAAAVAGLGDADTANAIGFSGIGLAVVVLFVGTWRIVRDG